MVTSRRSFLIGATAALVGIAAPAVIRTPGLLMPVRKPVGRLRDYGLIAEYIEKAARPPMLASPMLNNSPVVLLPGAISYISARVQFIDVDPMWLAERVA